MNIKNVMRINKKINERIDFLLINFVNDIFANFLKIVSRIFASHRV